LKKCQKVKTKEIQMQSSPTPEEPMSRKIVLDAVLDESVDTRRVEVRRIDMNAGFAPGRHVHNGPVFGNIVGGSVLFQVAGEPSKVLRPGDVFYEPAGVAIDHFDALDEDVTFLGFFLLRHGEVPEIK
jgi:quercetin dioxygenase-like cupin family protein